MPLRSVGALVLATGTVVLLWCVRDFFVSGRGTLAPWGHRAGRDDGRAGAGLPPPRR